MKTKFKMPDRMYLPPNMGHIAKDVPGAYADSSGMIIVPVDATDINKVCKICCASLIGTQWLLAEATK